MIFQLLDDRNECYGIYGNNEFIYDRVPDNIRRTWSWDHRLADRDIDYASIYCAGQTMASAAPENLRHRLEKREAKIRAFVKSALISKMNMASSLKIFTFPSFQWLTIKSKKNYTPTQ